MLTPNPAEAREFFGKVLGWTYGEIPGMGYIIQVGGRRGRRPLRPARSQHSAGHAAADRRDGEGRQRRRDRRPRSTRSAARRSRRSTSCERAAWRSASTPTAPSSTYGSRRRSPGTDVDSDAHGAPSWFETLTTDVKRGDEVLHEPLRLEGGADARSPDIDYTTFKLGDKYVAGMMGITPEMGDMRPHWGVYFTVKDVDETAQGGGEAGRQDHGTADRHPDRRTLQRHLLAPGRDVLRDQVLGVISARGEARSRLLPRLVCLPVSALPE